MKGSVYILEKIRDKNYQMIKKMIKDARMPLVFNIIHPLCSIKSVVLKIKMFGMKPSRK